MFSSPTILIAVVATSNAGAAGAAEQALDTPLPEIVVVGERATADPLPLLQFESSDLQALGTSTVAGVLEAIRPQTRSGRSDSGPITLVNGRRIFNLSEIRDLPTEAIARVEVLSEQVALRHGYPADQRVVNFVLRPSFQATTQEGKFGISGRGGRSSSEWAASLLRLTEGGRWQLTAEYERNSSLLESELNIVQPGDSTDDVGRHRTLIPKSKKLSLGGTVQRALTHSVSGSATATARYDTSEALLGNWPDSRSGAFTRKSESVVTQLAIGVSGYFGSWRWSAAATYDRAHTDVRSESLAGEALTDIDGKAARFELTAAGPLARTAAGEILLTTKAGFEQRGLNSVARLTGTKHVSELHRRKPSARTSLHIPLASRRAGALKALGNLSLNLNAAVAELSDFGSMRSFGYALQWSPVERLNVTASFANDDGAPTMQQLGDPILSAPYARIYDFRSNEVVVANLLEGGNPELGPANRKLRSIALSVRPFKVALSLDAQYTSTRTQNPIAQFPGATPEIENAFPSRFGRDAEGRLIRLDARALNFDRSARDELRSGANYSATVGWLWGARAQLSLYHNWTLKDEVVVREGGPKLDFLNGSVASERGGRPRHQVEFQGSLATRGVGARVTAHWQSGTLIHAGNRSSDLAFSDLWTVNLRLFADLGHKDGSWPTAAWMKGLRLSLDVDNLLDHRIDVRDWSGRTPFQYHGAFLDPLGRSVRVSLRRLFSN